jgi:hypothetical protein
MDTEIKSFLEGLRGQVGLLGEQISSLREHNDSSLKTMELRLREHTDSSLKRMEFGVREHTDTVGAQLEARLREHTENVETRLLSEFWKWARSAEIKSRQTSENIIAMEQRLMSVEERLSDLERRRAS